MAKKQEKKQRYIVLGIALALVIIAFIVVLVVGKKDYAGFAGCLADEGYVMGGTSWCPHCQAQKAMFKGAFEDVMIPAGAYHDCDVEPDWCQENGIQGYPTWITPDGNQLVGEQSLKTLSRVSGCSLS